MVNKFLSFFLFSAATVGIVSLRQFSRN